MIRPPPLQLKLDNRFPNPVRSPSQPKPKSFVSQLYKASWKNPIIAVAGLNGLRFAFSCYNAFADAIVDDAEVAENLTKVSIALAVMYLTAFLIEIYGIIGVSIQRLGLIRAYLYLTLFASVLVTAAGVLKGVSYFAFAEELMHECISLAMEGRGAEKSLFRSRPWPSSMYGISHGAARKQCVYAWVHHSWSQVAAVFLFSFIPSVIYYVMVYAYYRQTINPEHSANLLETYSRSGRRPTRQANYNQVGYSQVANTIVSTSTMPLPVARQRSVASHAQAPRITSRRSNIPGGVLVAGTKRLSSSSSLQRSHRPPPLMRSPSPVGLSHTPPPPSYRPSRVYAAFAAPAPCDPAAYDKFI